MSIASDYVAEINELEPDDYLDDVINDYALHGNAEQVEREIQTQLRWHNVIRCVYRCADGSYFAVTLREPLTEDQEDRNPKARAELVEPREVTVTRYVAIKAGA